MISILYPRVIFLVTADCETLLRSWVEMKPGLYSFCWVFPRSKRDSDSSLSREGVAAFSATCFLRHVASTITEPDNE